MNKFKWQYFIVGECKMDFQNSFWIYLPDSIITVDVNHRQPEQAIISHRCSGVMIVLRCRRAEKDFSHVTGTDW